MASKEFSVPLGLANTPETQNPEVFFEAVRLYNAVKQLAYYLDRYTGAISLPTDEWDTALPSSTVRLANMSRLYLPASEALTAGQVVNVWDDAGTTKVRKANATTTGKPCHGWVAASYSLGATAEIFTLGICTSIAGLTAGTTYYLSTTDGTITNGAPANKQAVGWAIDSTTLYFNPHVGF